MTRLDGAEFDGPKFDDKRLAELKDEVEILNKAVLDAVAGPPHLRRRSGRLRQPAREGRRNDQRRSGAA